jgi:hypothetical protein
VEITPIIGLMDLLLGEPQALAPWFVLTTHTTTSRTYPIIFLVMHKPLPRGKIDLDSIAVGGALSASAHAIAEVEECQNLQAP